MELIVACGVCGMDPGTDSLVLHSLIAAGIASPWYFRARVFGFARAVRNRVRGEPDAADSCPITESDSGAEDDR